MTIKIVECFSVAPSPGAAAGAEQSLPLVYFDMMAFQCHPTETLYFYGFKCSESYFLDTIVLQLKQSLSLTLKHFLPLAGKIIFPLASTTMPVFRYTAGDSVSLTIALSDADFVDMTGNHSRAAHQFHSLVAKIPAPVYSEDDIKFSSIAVQATFFPNHGICIGFTQHHALCDGRSQVRFIQAWASVNKLNGDRHLVGNALPFYDRSSVQNPRLDSICWEQARMSRPTFSFDDYLPPQMVRATFVLTDSQIERLKNIAMMKKPTMGRVSSFIVVCAYFWSCLAKSWEETAEDEVECFVSPVDCRTRLEPPLPENYFGNCLASLFADSSNGKLRGINYEGYIAAVEAIVAGIGKTPLDWRGVAEFYENRQQIMSQVNGKKVVWFVGSSRLMEHYEVDYGWGRPVKYESIHTDFDGTVGLCKGRDGGVEMGFSMPKPHMDAFADIFNKQFYINSSL